MASSKTPPQVVEDPDLRPDCPHCGKALTRVLARALTTDGSASVRFGKRFAYACPHCNKLLGISHRKGFWMG
jgi:phage FluMu protein Com